MLSRFACCVDLHTYLSPLPLAPPPPPAPTAVAGTFASLSKQTNIALVNIQLQLQRGRWQSNLLVPIRGVGDGTCFSGQWQVCFCCWTKPWSCHPMQEQSTVVGSCRHAPFQMASQQRNVSERVRGVQTNADTGMDAHARNGKLLHTTLASLEASRKMCVCVGFKALHLMRSDRCWTSFSGTGKQETECSFDPCGGPRRGRGKTERRRPSCGNSAPAIASKSS